MAGTVTKFRNKLLQDPAIHHVDVLCHYIRVVEDVKQAIAAGLKPGNFRVIGDAVVLRFVKEKK